MKITAKVYTGKNAKTYKLKTNKDGNAVLNTKGIKVKKHKVKITFSKQELQEVFSPNFN